MIVSYWWLEHQVDLGRRVRLAAAGDLGADRAVRHIMTEAEAVATPLGVGLPQPMEKRSVNLPTAAHAVQVLWGTNALQREADGTAVVEARQRCEA
jgi:hypothetical protein